jgi:hypothetical protein
MIDWRCYKVNIGISKWDLLLLKRDDSLCAGDFYCAEIFGFLKMANISITNPARIRRGATVMRVVL